MFSLHIGFSELQARRKNLSFEYGTSSILLLVTLSMLFTAMMSKPLRTRFDENFHSLSNIPLLSNMAEMFWSLW